MKRINLNHNYEAAYKKRRSGKLMWLTCYAETSKEADTSMDIYVQQNHPNEGFRRYAGALLIK